jgi:lipopolysaccharide O-acetyltransferase
LNRFWQFRKENGFYVLAASLSEHWTSLARNHLIARKLGVKEIRIGPRAHLRGLSSIEMGEDLRAGDGLWLEAITTYDSRTFAPKILIGKHVRISHFVHIAATNFVEIGDGVLMGSKVMITDHNHGQYSQEQQSSPYIAPSVRLLDRDRRTVIGRNVWLGDGVVVTAGASIGEGSVIGANSVVTGTIPAFSIAVGIPATVRKTFNFDTGKWCNAQ